MRTPEQLAELAFDIEGGKVFTTWHMPKGEANLSIVFMPLALMDKEGMEEFRKREPVMIYEYLDKSAPRSVNGMPSFMSMNLLNAEEAKIVWDKLDEIEAFRKKLSKPAAATPPTEEPKKEG